MKQEEYFIPMTEEYRNLHFPGGFFETMDRNSKKNTKAVCDFAGLLIVFFSIPVIAGLKMLLAGSQTGEKGSMIFGLFFTAVGTLFILFGVGMIRMSRQRSRLGVDGFIKVCAEGAGYSEEEVRAFGEQATEPDSYAVQLKGKAEAGSWGLGILTRDYVFFSGSDRLLMKKADISLACLEEVQRMEGRGKNKNMVRCLEIVLLLDKKEGLRMRSSKEGGKKLISMLKKQYPALDTAEGKTLSEKEFDAYCEKKFS